ELKRKGGPFLMVPRATHEHYGVPNLLPRHAGLPPPVHRHPREGHGRLPSVLHRGLGNASRRKEGADAADGRRGGDAEEPRWRPAPRTELVRRGKSIRSS